MLTWIRRVLTVIGLLVVLVAVVGAVAALLTRERVPERTVLQIDFERAMIESVPEDPVARVVLGERLVVRDLVDALDRAADDDRVLGVLARIGGAHHGFAVTEELRQALARFRASGKPAIAYAETIGEAGPGNAGYYLASAFDEIYLQPSGDIGLTGLIDESVFLAGVLERLEIEARMDHRHEYKSALNLFTEREYTDAHREVNAALLESTFENLLAAVAGDRDMAPEMLRELIDAGPFFGGEAVEAGLIDGLAFRSEVRETLRERLDDTEFETLSPARYLSLAGRPHQEGPRVALIHGTGAVVRGEGGFNPLFGSASMGADAVTRAFRDAIEDETIEAILFRIDSPGGSYVASDAIWRMVGEAREAGKPVVASMGNVAGSGGYFVAMAADRIVAQPSTLTGSIGVVGGKMLTGDFWQEWLGVSFDSLQSSDNAAMYSSLHDYTEHGWQRHQDWLDRVYEDFVAKAAQGRGMRFDALEALARGRVWTGAQAHERGLIDALGGYEQARLELRALLEIEPDAPVELVAFPQPQPLWRRLLQQREERALAQAALHALEELRPAAQALRRAGVLGRREALELPHVPELR